MSIEENKAVVRRAFDEVLSGGNLERADDLYAPDCAFHGLPPGYEGRTGPSVVKELCTVYAEAFPDQRYDVEALIAEGDLVSARWRVRGTHGNALELGPISVLKTGRQVDVQGFSMCRVEDGRITEVWQVADMMTAFQQMGADVTGTTESDS